MTHPSTFAAADWPGSPVNVRLMTSDGRHTLPVDCRYLEYRDGLHHWEVVTPVPEHIPFCRVVADSFPPRTAIDFPINIEAIRREANGR